MIEQDIMILETLNQQGTMTVSQITGAIPNARKSNTYTAITKLWCDRKLVSKKRNYLNQRTHIIELTNNEKKVIETPNKQRAERFHMLYEAIQMTEKEKQLLLKILARTKLFFNNHLKVDCGTN